MIEYIPNAVHIPCDCERCVKIEAVIERLKKRLEEVTPNGYIPTRKLVWTDEAFSIVKVELQKIIGEREKPQRMVSTKEGREELAKYDVTADSW